MNSTMFHLCGDLVKVSSLIWFAISPYVASEQDSSETS